MKKLLVAIVLLCLLTTYFSCRKTGIANKYFLTDEMKSQNPFSGGEKLYYVSDSAEQFILSGGERSNEILKVPLGNDLSYYNLYEFYKIQFTSGVDFGFYFDMHINRDPIFFIDFHCENKGKSFTFILPLSEDITPNIDSLQIQGQWYYNVFVAEEEKAVNRAYKLYYSTKYGVVKIDFSDGSYWELEKIEW